MHGVREAAHSRPTGGPGRPHLSKNMATYVMQLGKTVRNNPEVKNAPKCRINVKQNTKNKSCLIYVRLVRFAAKLCLKVEK